MVIHLVIETDLDLKGIGLFTDICGPCVLSKFIFLFVHLYDAHDLCVLSCWPTGYN